jgi:hypothetical protein
MKKFIVFDTPTGARYEIKTEALANLRLEEKLNALFESLGIADDSPREEAERVFKEQEAPLRQEVMDEFETDANVFAFLARLHWQSVQGVARLVRAPVGAPLEMHRCHITGADERQQVDQPTPDMLPSDIPLGLWIAMMEDTDRWQRAFLLNDQMGALMGAIILVHADKEKTTAFIGACQQLEHHLRKGAPPPPARKKYPH